MRLNISLGSRENQKPQDWSAAINTAMSLMNLSYAEFYITNVCNLNCPNCNRFNNFSFSGHSSWEEYKEHYSKWAKILKIDEIGILGGEPMLNPDFMSWLRGIRDLWPKSKINVITNGTQLNKFPDFYDYVSKNSKHIKIKISYHGFIQKEKVVNDIKNWLQQPVKITFPHNKTSDESWQQSWNNIKDPSWPDCSTPQDFINLPSQIQKECTEIHNVSLDSWQNEFCLTNFTDCNGVEIQAGMSNQFHTSTVLFDSISQTLSLNNSDPQKALDVCYGKKCHHFIRGKLYKCGPMGILPEFIKQFNVKIFNDDLQLLNSYKPAEPDWDQRQIESFIDDLKNKKVIPQCKFCPETIAPKKFEAGTKKIKLVKIN
jgi:organic radical activating enzyme